MQTLPDTELQPCHMLWLHPLLTRICQDVLLLDLHSFLPFADEPWYDFAPLSPHVRHPVRGSRLVERGKWVPHFWHFHQWHLRSFADFIVISDSKTRRGSMGARVAVNRVNELGPL